MNTIEVLSAELEQMKAEYKMVERLEKAVEWAGAVAMSSTAFLVVCMCVFVNVRGI